MRAGDHTRARAALDDAIAMMDQTGQRGPEPEVMRIGAQLDRSEGASQDEVLKRLCSAADLALDCGSLLFAARALRDADQVLAGRLDEHGHDLTERAARLYAILPASADGERREMERLLSASA